MLGSEPTMDSEFERICDRYVDEFAAFSPVRATGLGGHRFDGQLDDVGDEARANRIDWIYGYVGRLEYIDVNRLSRDNQVDYALLKQDLDSQLWQLTELREWEWNPLIYTRLLGDAVY